jgi:histidyl-tRNA synthetase
LKDRGLIGKEISIVGQYLGITGSDEEKLQQLQELIGNNDGIGEVRTLVKSFQATNNCTLKTDLTLARGLNYYTGIIYEVKASGVEMGSIGGGGRYDDLTGLFGVANIPGVGISFGLDRIYDVMDEMDLFPADLSVTTKVLFFNLGEKESMQAYRMVQLLRENDTGSELFHEPAKMDKQFKYAEKKNIPFVAIIGERELNENTCTIKELSTGKQETIKQDELSKFQFQ